MMKVRLPLSGCSLLAALALSACGGSDGSPSASTTAAAPVPPVVAPVVPTLDVTPCLQQTVGGRSVASLVVPDVITLNLAQASSFPNGRTPADPVIDLTLAVLFLDLKTHPADTLAKLPLNPSGNDRPLPTTFPYLSEAWGGAPAAGEGSGFVFRTDAPAAYTRVDRMGEPAVSTALISTASKNAYNDDSPADDATGKWVPELAADLKGLAEALQDDFAAAGLKICAVKK